MGGLSVEADSGKSYPGYAYFATSDSKWLAEVLTDQPFIPVCSSVLNLDLSPLTKIVTENWIPGISPVGSESWTAYLAEAWQPPNQLIKLLDTFVERLNADPTIFTQLEEERLNQNLHFLNIEAFDDEEIASGGLQEGLIELRRVVALAAQEGASRIRIYFS